MTTFYYEAVEPSGNRRAGLIEASDQESAVATITQNGLFVVKIGPETRSAAITITTGKKRITKNDVALFTRRMADLAAAGLPLDRVLAVVAEQSENPSLTEIALDALEQVRTGQSVSAALAKFPKVFNSTYTQTLRAGEAGGQFPEVATRLAELLEVEVSRRSQLMAALIYPAVLSCTAVFVVIFLLTFVVPRLSGIFKGLGDSLPATTKMLLAFTGFLTSSWILILGAIAGLVLLYRGWVATEAGALTRDTYVLRAPLIGKIWMKAVIARYSHVLATLLFGGVPILESLEIAGLAAGNRRFLRSSEAVANDVKEGRSIAGSMKDTGVFPPVLTNMVAIGEETGDLPKMLTRVATSLDFEVDIGMRRLSALAEPIIVVLMGGVVGFVVLSVLLPIYQAQELVK